MPDLGRLNITREDSPPGRTQPNIERADRSDIDDMVSIFHEAYGLDNIRLAQLMCPDDPLNEAIDSVVRKILQTHMDRQDCEFMVVYDVAEGQRYELIDWGTNDLIFGWISAGVVYPGATRHGNYAASELTTCACLTVLSEQARARGQNHLSLGDPCTRLLHELGTRSKDGQARCTNNPHMVLNALVLWPEPHEATLLGRAVKLLEWAVSLAERRNMSLWAQIPVNQMPFFRHVGFRDMGIFTLNLNDFAPGESPHGWGTQDWAQMVKP